MSLHKSKHSHHKTHSQQRHHQQNKSPPPEVHDDVNNHVTYDGHTQSSSKKFSPHQNSSSYNTYLPLNNQENDLNNFRSKPKKHHHHHHHHHHSTSNHRHHRHSSSSSHPNRPISSYPETSGSNQQKSSSRHKRSSRKQISRNSSNRSSEDYSSTHISSSHSGDHRSSRRKRYTNHNHHRHLSKSRRRGEKAEYLDSKKGHENFNQEGLVHNNYYSEFDEEQYSNRTNYKNRHYTNRPSFYNRSSIISNSHNLKSNSLAYSGRSESVQLQHQQFSDGFSGSSIRGKFFRPYIIDDENNNISMYHPHSPQFSHQQSPSRLPIPAIELSPTSNKGFLIVISQFCLSSSPSATEEFPIHIELPMDTHTLAKKIREFYNFSRSSKWIKLDILNSFVQFLASPEEGLPSNIDWDELIDGDLNILQSISSSGPFITIEDLGLTRIIKTINEKSLSNFIFNLSFSSNHFPNNSNNLYNNKPIRNYIMPPPQGLLPPPSLRPPPHILSHSIPYENQFHPQPFHHNMPPHNMHNPNRIPLHVHTPIHPFPPHHRPPPHIPPSAQYIHPHFDYFSNNKIFPYERPPQPLIPHMTMQNHPQYAVESPYWMNPPNMHLTYPDENKTQINRDEFEPSTNTLRHDPKVSDINDDLKVILTEPSAKQIITTKQYQCKNGTQLKEICKFGTQDECCRMHQSIYPCTNVHFKRIILSHTDPSLGDCSYLDTCRHIETCKFVHYEIDKGRHSNSTKHLKSHEIGYIYNELNVFNIPPQWIHCDIRKVDFSIFRSVKIKAIMADPPWDIHMDLPYGTMTDTEMRGLRVDQIQTDGLLFLWVTGRAMEVARECMELWGYHRVEEIVWVKTNQLQRIIRTGRTGHWLNHSKEHCLVGIKGDTKINKGIDCDVIVSEVRETSRKPDEIYRLIERLCPNSLKIELFGRHHNAKDNWITLGNQIQGVKLHHPVLIDKYNQNQTAFGLINKNN